MTGSRRTYNPIVGGGGSTMAGGTPALGDSAVLADLITNLQNFYAAQPSMGGPQNAGPSIIDVLNQSVGNDLSQQGPGGEMSAPAPGTPTISPAALAALGSILGAGGTVMNNEAASGIGGMMSIAGNMAQQNPLDALQGMASVGASLAGANPGVVAGANTVINMLQDPVPPTAGDLAGKALNIALSLSPIGPVNTIMGLLTGKTLGDVAKGAMTPVENAIPNMVPGVNPSAAVQMGTPAQPDTPPGIALTDLALSMLNAPTPMAEATPTSPEAPMGTPSSVDTSIADAIAEAMSAMAESSMNAPSDSGSVADATGDSGSVGDSAPSSPSDGDGVAY
jgi:hypothetical protein